MKITTLIIFLLFSASIFPQKKIGRHTLEEWQTIIDTTWGAGSTNTHLTVFEKYWNLVDQSWAGFPNLNVNWDSLKNVYRPLVEGGVSRGRFYGILSRLTRALNEWHVFTLDQTIDNAMGYHSQDYVNEYPNYPSYLYKPGIPVLNINPITFRTNFGAGITPLPDSTVLVYSVMPDHPLGLQPGDIILGYDGVLWKELIPQLLEAEFPILGGGNLLGSSPLAEHHVLMLSTGMNWGLFDTIDVLKYSTKEIVHLPTSALSAISPPYHVATEQLPVEGVAFPDIQNNKMVSWGTVEGTNIGYIYIWDWQGKPSGETRDLFGKAVDELLHVNKVSGLIIDFRNNPGGWPEYANEGFKHLFNFDPTLNYSRMIRNQGTDHLAFNNSNPRSQERFTPTKEIFDHPLAVLTGPLCGSSGDYNSFRLRFHPMTRFFGKPANGAYTAWSIGWYGAIADDYICRVDDASIFSNYNNEGYMIHKPFNVDEEVWLTPEGAAAGEDDVVKKALDWINSLVYGHNLTLSNTYIKPGIDTLRISLLVENPDSHQPSVLVYIKNKEENFADSVQLNKKGPSDESELWEGSYVTAGTEDIYHISYSVQDNYNAAIRINNFSAFTTAGPLTVDSVLYNKGNYNVYNIRPFVHNRGTNMTIKNLRLRITINDPWVTTYKNELIIPDLGPGLTEMATSISSVRYIDSLFRGYFNLKFELLSDGWVFWSDSLRLEILESSGPDENLIISEFKLEQNFPNPFNAATKINYKLPENRLVSLKIFDALGREAAVLVSEEKHQGTYEVIWNAESIPSGVYYYRLQAGDFIETKKMILMK